LRVFTSQAFFRPEILVPTLFPQQTRFPIIG